MTYLATDEQGPVGLAGAATRTRVLLVEDPIAAQATTRAITRTVPCVVRAVDSAAAMIPVLRTFTPDVILSDHSPPRFHAIEALRAAQQVSPHVPLIVMMEAPDLETIVECFKSGAVDVVGKAAMSRLGPAVLGALGLRHMRDAMARAETRLRDSEERFRLLADNLPGVVYLRRNDERQSILYVNAAVETLTGYSREAFLDGSITLSGLCHPADHAVCDAEIKRAMAAGLAFHLVYRLRHQSRGWRWVEDSGVGVCRDGEPIQVEGFLSDITERRQMERRSEQRRERTQATFASIGDGVITADVSGRIDSMNPVAERLTGWVAAEARGRLLTDLIRALGNGHQADDAVAISRDGTELAIAGTAAPVRDRNGKSSGAVVVFHDATLPRAAAKRLSYQATHDALTGLINRAEFERRLARAVQNAQQESAHHSLCYLDLDNFKRVNDTDGHAAGDAVLHQLGSDLGRAMRTRDTLCRLGGDEFGLLLEHCNEGQAREVAAGLLRRVAQSHVLWKGREVSIEISIGVAAISSTSENAAAVLRDADAACYAAKRRGGNCVEVFRDPAFPPAASGERPQ